jgi:nucleoside phosphorylase
MTISCVFDERSLYSWLLGKARRVTSEPSLLVLAALAWEAKLVRAALRDRAPEGPRDVRIVACGIGEERASAALAGILPPPDLLLLVGCAGALDPRLRPGDLVVADRIVDSKGETFACEAALRSTMEDAARRAGISAKVAGILGSGEVVGSLEEKRRAAESSGCVAVDMESAAISRHADRHGIPAAVVRAILDPADVALTYAPLCVESTGDVSIAGLLRALARGRSHAVRELAGLAGPRRAAVDTLRRFLRALFERSVQPPERLSGIAKRRTDR